MYTALEDEFGPIPYMVFGKLYELHEHECRSPFMVVKGRLSRRDGMHNVVINWVKLFRALDWSAILHSYGLSTLACEHNIHVFN